MLPPASVRITHITGGMTTWAIQALLQLLPPQTLINVIVRSSRQGGIVFN
jgi:hypothetical protein